MNAYEILLKYYNPQSPGYLLLFKHSQAVADLAILIAEKMNPPNLDFQFIRDASLLHDIGVYLCDAPSIGCFGTENYMRHGILGREILEREGYPQHALVCERHIGVGLTIQDIQQQNLPLPQREMIPISHEEKIITIADLFSSKLHPDVYKSIENVENKLAKLGMAKLVKFQEWKKFYKLDQITILTKRSS